jgi:hypothetical protein
MQEETFEKKEKVTKKSQQSEPTINLSSKKWPCHFQRLIIKFGGDRTVSPLPENGRLVAERTQYQNAFKYFVRAQTNLNPNNLTSVKELKNRKQTFQDIQRKALRNHGTLDVITRIRKIPEDADLDLSIDFKDAIEDIEHILCPFLFTTNPYDPTILKTRPRTDKSPSKCTKQTIPCYYLEQQELKLATEQLQRFLSHIKRVIKIQKSIWLRYYEYYVLENIHWTSWEQWGNWYYDTKRVPTLDVIKKYIEEKHPYSAYKVLLMGLDPTLNSLNCIGQNKLALYLRNNELFCKIKNKDEIQIRTLAETSGLSFGRKAKDETAIYKRFREVLTSEEKSPPTIKDQYRLIDFASACGYLSDDFSPEEFSRIEEETNEMLSILQNNPVGHWEWIEDKWARNPKKDVSSKKIEDDGPTEKELDALYSLLPKSEESVDNVQSYPTLQGWKRVTEGWQNLTQDSKEEWNKKRLACELDAFLHKKLHMAHRIIDSAGAHIHRKKMIKVFEEFHKFQNKINDQSREPQLIEEKKRYIKKDFEKYQLLYGELDKVINTYIDQEFVLNTPYSPYSRIPVCLEFFQSEHYSPEPLEEIYLIGCNLSDESFYREIPSENRRFSTKEEKTRKGELLFTRYKTINISHNKITSLQILASFSNLTDLNVSYNKINGLATLHYPKFLQSLTSLDLSYNPIPTTSMISSQLRSFTALTGLSLSGNKKLFEGESKNDLFRTLATLPILNSLTIVNCGLKGKWSELFPIGLDHLLILDVRENPEITLPDHQGDLNLMFHDLKSLKTDQKEFIWK